MSGKLLTVSMAVALFIGVVCCSENKPSSNDSVVGQDIQDMTPAEIEISIMEVVSPEFPDAGLELLEPAQTNYPEGTIKFNFELMNYDLGSQTLDAGTKQCANSGKGQHIHLIVNGEPYTALYEPAHELELTTGNYVVLSFLSRSYHESIKHYGAYALRQFSVGEADSETVDLNAPHLFYSRPKGVYKGADTEKVLLDFYLVNTELSSDGNKVRATINDQEILIDKWAPYFIKGLPQGESTIMLELVDDEGNLIPGPFNSVKRSITLVNEDAI